MSNYRIRVEYWVGTQQHTGYATTYRGATRIAGRNRNAYDACMSTGWKRVVNTESD